MQFDQKRRSFITLLGSAAAWPLAARAQQPGKTPRVGYIRAGTPRNDPFREEFVRGMRDLGYVEGRNIAYEFRHYGDDVESIPSLIGDLLRAKVDIIVVGGTAAIRAAQSATQSIPIVMGAAADPLESGLIAGLARPGGSTTGLSLLSGELAVKRLEILKQVMTKAARIAILQQPANPAHSLFIKEVEPIAGAQCIASGRRLLNQFALNNRQDGWTGVLVHTRFRTRLPPVIVNLNVCGVRD